MKKLNSIFGLLLLFSQVLAAQDKPIYAVGIITDENTGDPIPFAIFKTRSGKSIGASNRYGKFELEVGARNLVMVVTRLGYEEMEVDLSDYEDLIDMEIELTPNIKRLRDIDVTADSVVKRDKFGNQTIAEAEQFTGQKIDLNDHLRQLPGVSGMTEYSSDISIYGGRTEDVTHYLGRIPIANMRHLDFGFPGNQSVLNPRVLKSIHVEDNLSSGPLAQGNSSALRYELAEGDSGKITGDVLIGTINQEFNFSGYWDSLTAVFSVRNLSPNFLSNMGKQFFTVPKESRFDVDCRSEKCQRIEEPIDIQSLDLMFSLFKNQGHNGYWRLFLLGASDDFKIVEDLASDVGQTEAQEVELGLQRDLLVAYEALNPYESGDLEYSISVTTNQKENEARDTSKVKDQPIYIFYGDVGTDNQEFKIMGRTVRDQVSGAINFNWASAETMFGADYGYGLEIKQVYADGAHKGHGENYSEQLLNQLNYFLTDGLLRMKWKFSGTRNFESSFGWHSVNYDEYYPVASGRLNQTLFKQNLYVDLSLRENTLTQPKGTEKIAPITTPSLGAKIGLDGRIGKTVKYFTSLYSRFYLDPTLPIPEVYWHYEEQQKANYAMVFGTNFYLRWEPSHHFGANFNGSVVQGDYYLDNTAIPWEANRTLDLVSNIRIVPRKDSLLSLIVTYTANNDVPLYDHEITLVPRGQTNQEKDVNPGVRNVRHSVVSPYVSRQRTDARINLDLSSKFKPLDYIRFFIQGNNLFGDVDNKFFNWLGGDNEKQRGWTRIKPGYVGDLTPITIRGLGFFWMFGVEMHLSI